MEIVEAPEFKHPHIDVDAGYQDDWAHGIATGHWEHPPYYPDPRIADTPYFRPPGYPFFLSFIYTLTGPRNYLAVIIAQMLLGLVNVLLAYQLAKRCCGQSVGLICAACMACYWVFIYFEGELHTPVVHIFLTLCLFNVLGLWLEKDKSSYALGAGALLGMTALFRSNSLLFLPFV